MFSFIKIKFFLSYIFLFFTRYPIFSLSFLIIISLLGIFAPLIAPYNPYVADTRARLMPPGIVSGLYNLQNFDLIKAEGQISQTPRWMQPLELENESYIFLEGFGMVFWTPKKITLCFLLSP